MADDSQEVADIIDGLGEAPAPLEVYNATRDYDTRYLASAGAAAAAAGGGGGSQPITREALYGNAVTITNGSNGSLTLDTSLGPDSLLDISTPDTPTIITAGTYAFTVGSSVGGSMTAGGGYDLTLAVDTAGENALTQATVVAGVHVTNPHASVTVVYHCPAGAAIAVQVNNNDGVQSLDFSVFELIVQRLA